MNGAVNPGCYDLNYHTEQRLRHVVLFLEESPVLSLPNERGGWLPNMAAD